MGEWERVRLVDLCEIHVDCVNRTAPVVEGPTPYRMIRTTNVRGGFVDTSEVRYVTEETYARWTRRLVPRRGDVILTREAPLGEVGKLRTDENIFLGQRLYHFRVDPRRGDTDFVLYALLAQDLQGQIRSLGSGATVEHMRLPDIEKLELDAPEVAIQRRIGSVLAAYDDLVENNTRRIGLLEEMARVLFRETFSRDEGVGESLRVSELIERGVLEVNDGYRAKNTELGTPGIPFARAGDINGGFLFDEADRLLDENVSRAGRKVSAPGDIVFTSKGTVGRFAWVRETTQRFVYSPQLCFWRVLRPEFLSARYLYRWMQTRAFLDQVDQVKGTTDMADYVSLSNQRRMRVTIPPIDRQHRYDELAGPIDELVGNLTDRTQRLRAARDLLLPKLLSGELSVGRIPDPAEAAP